MTKFVVFVLAVYGACYYVTKHYEFHDTLEYAKKHTEASYAPAIDYYVGLIYYQRAEYPKAQEAFTQLLTDFATTGYYAPKALPMMEDTAEYNRDWDAAKQASKDYIETYPNGKDIELMRKRLELANYQHP